MYPLKPMKNAVARFEIYVSDMERAKNFYAHVLQKGEWVDLSGVGDGNAAMKMFAFPRSDAAEGASGALVQMDGFSPSSTGTIVYFLCDDCAVEESRVVAHGGKVLQSKNAIGEFGFMSLIQDTEGNTIGLHSMK